MNVSIAVHENKKSEKVEKFISGDDNTEVYFKLIQYCSKKMAKRILNENENGSLYGVWFTKSGRIRASFN